MSPARRLLVLSVAFVVAVVLVFAALSRLLDSPERRGPAADQAVPGPVLLVPGYGGGTAGLEVLAAALRAAGRPATVVPVPGDGTGDLRLSAQALQAAVVATGAPSVDVIGYSAGGVVARLWAKEHPELARRVVTLGSPHHGTKVAGIGAVFAPGACPVACQQLAPGSDLLDDLNDGDETPEGPRWLSVWTTQDEIVTPPDSARLDGALNVALQELCRGISVTHGQLPTARVVQSLVLQAVSAAPLTEPTTAACTA